MASAGTDGFVVELRTGAANLCLMDTTPAAADPVMPHHDIMTRVYNGGVFVIAGTVMSWLAFLLGSALGIVLSLIAESSGRADGAGPLLIGVLFLYAVAFLGGLIAAPGWWMVGTPWPARLAGHQPRPMSRVVLRVTAASGLLLLLACGGVLVFMFATFDPGERNGLRMVGLSILLGVMGGVVQLNALARYAASMVYLRWLGGRVGNEWVVRRCETLAWAGPLMYVLASWLMFLGPFVAVMLQLQVVHRLNKSLAAADERGESEVAPAV